MMYVSNVQQGGPVATANGTMGTTQRQKEDKDGKDREITNKASKTNRVRDHWCVASAME